MVHLLAIEWLKIKSYRAFWWILGITAMSYVGISFSSLFAYQQLLNNPQLTADGAKMIFGNPFSFDEVWHTLAYVSSLLVTIPALMIIMLITNEYSFRTHRQNIIDGWSRKQFITAKLLDVLSVTILVTAMYTAISLFVGSLDTETSSELSNAKTGFIGYFFLQTFSQLSIAFSLGMIFRKSFIALGVFIFWSVIFEPLLTKILATDTFSLGHYLPFEISDRMIPPPAFLSKVDPLAYQSMMDSTNSFLIYTLLFTVLLWIGCFQINAKRDL